MTRVQGCLRSCRVLSVVMLTSAKAHGTYILHLYKLHSSSFAWLLSFVRMLTHGWVAHVHNILVWSSRQVFSAQYSYCTVVSHRCCLTSLITVDDLSNSCIARISYLLLFYLKSAGASSSFTYYYFYFTKIRVVHFH